MVGQAEVIPAAIRQLIPGAGLIPGAALIPGPIPGLVLIPGAVPGELPGVVGGIGGSCRNCLSSCRRMRLRPRCVCWGQFSSIPR